MKDVALDDLIKEDKQKKKSKFGLKKNVNAKLNIETS